MRSGDAIATYRAVAEANDLERMMSMIAPDATLVSPLSGRMAFKGADDLRVLLGPPVARHPGPVFRALSDGSSG